MAIRTFCLLSAMLLTPAVSLVGANHSVESGAGASATVKPTTTPEQITALIASLGSQQFAERERATRELLNLGMEAQPALEKATKSADAEVRVRARTILAEVTAAEFQRRLEAFAADADGAKQLTLPAWEIFSARYGDHRPARQLFVSMQRCEPLLLAALAESPAAATAALNARTREIIDGQRESLAELGTLASLLFVGASEGVTANEDGCLHVYPFVVQSTYHRNYRTALWPGLLKKLVGDWIAKDTTPAMTNQNLTLAAQLGLEQETLTIASRVLSSTEAPPGAKQIAVLMVGRFGDQEDLPLVEPLLNDKSVVGKAQVDDPPRQVDLQMRDIALAAMLHMTGQNLYEYGYHYVQEYTPTVFQVGTLGFEDDEARAAALKKWARWRAEHPAE
jgi:hypothetical protein